MSYHIYTSSGIILKRTPFGEANIMLHILTLDLGLIIASARSARVSGSKLRPALQEYSLVTISAIKGKNGWKITNVSQNDSFYYEMPEYTHIVVSQVSSILLQMIQGEFPEKQIFEIVKSGFLFLKEIDREKIKLFEILIVLRILRELGYVEAKPEVNVFFENLSDWNNNLLLEVDKNKQNLINIINKALKESHL